MAKKTGYVEDGFVEQVEWYLYNEKDIKELFEDEEKEEVLDKEWLQCQLLDKEEYIHPEHYPKFAITNKGRVLNLKTKRQLKVVITNRTVHLNTTDFRFKSRDVFEEMGWKHDINVIHSNYDKYNWKYTKIY